MAVCAPLQAVTKRSTYVLQVMLTSKRKAVTA